MITKRIQQAFNINEIEKIVNDELLKVKEKKNDILLFQFLTETKKELKKINAIDVNSSEWGNIKTGRLHVNSLMVSFKLSISPDKLKELELC